jgi:hypothetical protein
VYELAAFLKAIFRASVLIGTSSIVFASLSCPMFNIFWSARFPA